MDSKELALVCRELADSKKADDIVVLDVRELSSITDYFVICSATSEPHLRAIADEIMTKLRDDHDVQPRIEDGGARGTWHVLDYFDVMVHVMRADTRRLYDLEGLWGDAPRLKMRRVRKAPAAGTTVPKVPKAPRKPRAPRASKKTAAALPAPVETPANN